MESPQIENGHTDIANELLEVLCRFRIPGNERQVFDCIMRKTWGWHKKEDRISNSQIVKMTGLYKAHVSRSLSKLITNKIVTKDGNNLCLNKHYDQWVSFVKLPKMVTNKKLPKVVTGVTKSDNKKLPEVVDTKETITKETITKETSLRDGASSQYGNQDINEIVKHLKEKMEIPKLDLSERVNRQYAYTLLRKSKTGLKGVLWLIDLASSDPWFKNHITSVKDLWGSQVKIVANKRGEVNKYVDFKDYKRERDQSSERTG